MYWCLCLCLSVCLCMWHLNVCHWFVFFFMGKNSSGNDSSYICLARCSIMWLLFYKMLMLRKAFGFHNCIIHTVLNDLFTFTSVLIIQTDIIAIPLDAENSGLGLLEGETISFWIVLIYSQNNDLTHFWSCIL